MGEPAFDEKLFDEEFYLSRHPGVAEAVKQGQFRSGYHHYTTFGYKENRISSYDFDPRRHDLMMRFCSVGINCEFGIAQRAFGAEPHDLLRWATTPPQVLIRLLENKFDGIGDPTQLDVYISGEDALNVRHKLYGFTWHAWETAGQTTTEAVRAREAKRLPFLSRKLMEDLVSGERIFVAKRPGMTIDEAQGILAAMHIYGRATLLYTTEGSPVSVEWQGPQLLHATIPKFADRRCVTITVSSQDWLKICEKATAEVALRN